ncbi:SCO2525 family SAM-dependent methyltransferase [Streptomyces sp. FZ201]|uniref:SCO2525 family SAM-dependent methyltransferase n=1 Tax=Streptomyces sp. FZ201 TaxID=3057122 RepID=UPI0021C02B91|nr:SCO2525 family SAM-dependent methyltransferase [Streptomyces sp. FZ201]
MGDAPLNSEASWAAFDPHAYVDHNYRYIHTLDAEILSIVRDHFGEHFPRRGDRPVTGIDVGAGGNLYPALAMLPWCDEITLLDRSSANVRYLRDQADSYDGHWDQFWHVLCKNEAYSALDVDPRARFRDAVSVQEGDIFDLARHEGRWSMGTMFFVAESITSSRADFDRGVECFLWALAPGAPFAAAFMAHSVGYCAGEYFFPACNVGEPEVRASLKRFTDAFRTVDLQFSADLREGQGGMIFAYGTR